MTSTPLHPQGVPVPQDALTPAQQLALITVLSNTLDTLAERLLESDPALLVQALNAGPLVSDLERLGFVRQFGLAADGGQLVIPNAQAFTLGFRLFAEDMVAMTGGSVL